MSPRPRGSRWQALRTVLRGTLWPLPAAAIAAAIAVGIGLPAVDEVIGEGAEPLSYLFGGGPSAARTMLSAIASSLISVTTLLFSLTIVTLQLASSQYSPRLLQTFVRDRVVQACLGILLGTFVYALMVLRTVRSADEWGTAAFVPRLSVTVALVLTLVSVGALVAFLSHQTRQLRVETMLRDVHVEAGATLRRLADAEADDARIRAVPGRARPMSAPHSGFLVQVSEAPLVAALADAGAVLRLIPRPGDAVIAGTPVAWVWSEHPADALAAGSLETALHEALVVGYEREDHCDPSYGIRKLVDIAVRALSPGINDPTTAVHALSHVCDLLGVARGRLGHRRLADDMGVERLVVPSWEFGALLDLAFTQPRFYGRDDPTVIDRLFTSLAELSWLADTAGQRAEVRRQRDLLVEQALAVLPAGRTAADVQHRADAVDAALAREWTAGR